MAKGETLLPGPQAEITVCVTAASRPVRALLPKTVSNGSLCILAVHTDSKACRCTGSLSSGDKPHNISQKRKDRTDQERDKCRKEVKTDKTGSEVWIKGQWNQRRNSWAGEYGHSLVWETLDVQLHEFGEDRSSTQTSEWLWGKGCRRECGASKNIHSKEHSEIFHNTEHAQDKPGSWSKPRKVRDNPQVTEKTLPYDR